MELIEEARAVARQVESARAKKLPGTQPREPEWLFPSPRANGPIEPKTVNHALRKAMEPTGKGKAAAIELRNVTPHDLRRTAASGMTALGVNRLVVSKVLNHVETGVTAIYDRHGYDADNPQTLDSKTVTGITNVNGITYGSWKEAIYTDEKTSFSIAKVS